MHRVASDRPNLAAELGGGGQASYRQKSLTLTLTLTLTINVYTLIHMKIEFDPAKDAKNLAKHGVSLALAESLEWDLIVSREDDREQYGEIRMAGYAPIGSMVYAVVYVETDEAYRIVSLRKAEPREVRYYASQV